MSAVTVSASIEIPSLSHIHFGIYTNAVLYLKSVKYTLVEFPHFAEL